MTSELLINSETARILTGIRTNLPQSLLLYGRRGIGLLAIARTLGDTILEIMYPTDSKGNPDKLSGSISVEEIRQLYALTKSRSHTRQLVIIDDADSMTVQAQQAFLKLLEEPNATIHFILTSHAPEKMLSTIRSRVQSYAILPIDHAQSHHYLQSRGLDEDTITKIMFIADGNPAQLHELATNERAREHAFAIIKAAREYLVADKYHRLTTALAYSDRADALEFIAIVISLLKFQLTKGDDTKNIAKLDRLIDLEQHISNGGNTKLSLARGVL